jgi:hypothetical protein
MINNKLTPKGEHLYALISTTQRPNVLIPVRAMVYDIKYDDVNPQYQIRIKKFYDKVYFLKKNMFGGRFMRDFEGSETRINLSRLKYQNSTQLVDEIFNGANWQKYLIVVDSVFCAKTIDELSVLFNNLQDFMFEMRLQELYEISTRRLYQKYDGTFSFPSRDAYKTALQKFLQGRMPEDAEWINKLLKTPKSEDLHDNERL